MSNYLNVFLAQRMLLGAGVVLVLAAGLTWSLRRRFDNLGARVMVFLFAVSSGVVVLATLLREPPAGPCLACLGDWQLAKVLAGSAGTDVLLNIALFVPPACVATLMWRAPWRVTGTGFLVSLAIEILQPLLGVGANDAIDLLANTTGALIGSGIAAIALLITDTLHDRSFDTRRILRTAVSVTACAAVLIGGPAWMATARQSAAAEQLRGYFAGTTLADYNAHRDTTWDSLLTQVATDTGNPTVTSRRDNIVARERYSWSIYFAVRCVIAAWTPRGFTAVQLDATACTQPLELHP